MIRTSQITGDLKMTFRFYQMLHFSFPEIDQSGVSDVINSAGKMSN